MLLSLPLDFSGCSWSDSAFLSPTRVSLAVLDMAKGLPTEETLHLRFYEDGHGSAIHQDEKQCILS